MQIRTSLRPLNKVFLTNKQIVRTVAVTSDTAVTKDNETLKSWKEIPGPSSLPFIGPLMHFFRGGALHNLHGRELTLKLYNTYGPIIRLNSIIGMDPIIFLFDAESSEQILRAEDNGMPIRQHLSSLEYYRHNKKGRKPGQPTGLGTDFGETWKKLRSTLNPVMLQPKTIKLYAKEFDKVTLEMVERIKLMRDENNMIKDKFDQEMNLWALESIGVVAFGCRVGCFSPNLSDDSPAKRLIRCVHQAFDVLEQLDVKPSLSKYISTPTFRRAMKIYEEQDTLSKYFINITRNNFKINPKTDAEKSILEKLLEIDENIAYIMASDFLFAGVDTTANSILGALYLLAVNQDKQNKLREELRSNPESKSYLKACLKESMRMMPIAPGNVRITSQEYNILGYKIPANVHMMFGHHDMAMMEKNFPRPEEYIPERWLVDKTDPLYYRNAHPFAYNPFGFGVRSCIGRRIAETEIEVFVNRIVENFHVDWKGPPPKVEMTLLNYVKGPYNYIFNDLK